MNPYLFTQDSLNCLSAFFDTIIHEETKRDFESGDCFRGFEITKLPHIYESDSCPGTWNEDKVDAFDTDLLGYYEHADKKVVLCINRIEKVGKKLSHALHLDEKLCIQKLTEIVLVHELGHWLTYASGFAKSYRMFEVDEITSLTIEGIIDETKANEMSEAFAQLFVYEFIKRQESATGLKRVFDELTRRQSCVYRKYQVILENLNTLDFRVLLSL